MSSSLLMLFVVAVVDIIYEFRIYIYIYEGFIIFLLLYLDSLINK